MNPYDPTIEKIKDINLSIAERVSSEAEKAKYTGKAILYSRAAREVGPFIAYLFYIAILNLLNVFKKLLDYEGVLLYIGVIFLFLLILAPPFVLYLGAKLYYEINSEKREKIDDSKN